MQVPMDLSDGCVSLISAYDAYLTPTHLVLALEPVLGGNLGTYVQERSLRTKHGLVMDEIEARYYFKVGLSSANSLLLWYQPLQQICIHSQSSAANDMQVWFVR